MDRNEMSSLLEFSSENSFNDTDEDSNWNDEDDDSSSEDESASAMRGTGNGDNWNNNFKDVQLNSNVMYNP